MTDLNPTNFEKKLKTYFSSNLKEFEDGLFNNSKLNEVHGCGVINKSINTQKKLIEKNITEYQVRKMKDLILEIEQLETVVNKQDKLLRKLRWKTIDNAMENAPKL